MQPFQALIRGLPNEPAPWRWLQNGTDGIQKFTRRLVFGGRDKSDSGALQPSLPDSLAKVREHAMLHPAS